VVLEEKNQLSIFFFSVFFNLLLLIQIIEDLQPRIIQQHCEVHQWILSTCPCLVACKGEFGGYSRMGTSSNISGTTIATVDGRVSIAFMHLRNSKCLLARFPIVFSAELFVVLFPFLQRCIIVQPIHL
jgi:hypothetical protein